MEGPVTIGKKKPTPPRHLKAATRLWWSQTVADFLLEAHHLRLLTLAAEAWDRCQQARAILDKKGLTYSDRGRPRTRPEVAVERDSRLAFARILRELGLDTDAAPDVRPPRLAGTGG